VKIKNNNFEALKKTMLPQLVAQTKNDDMVRVSPCKYHFQHAVGPSHRCNHKWARICPRVGVSIDGAAPTWCAWALSLGECWHTYVSSWGSKEGE
jgi:hypothetical protein